MAKKNENLVDKALRYGEAFLGRGVFGVGQEAIHDYKEYQEEQSWEESALTELESAYDSEQYVEAWKMANELLNNSNIDEDTQRIAKWIKALSCSQMGSNLVDSNYSIRDEENNDAFDVLKQAEDLFYSFGNEYGWSDGVLFQIMLIEEELDWIIDARNTAIYLINSDDADIRTTAIKLYESITDDLLSSGEFCDSVAPDQRKYIYIGRDIRSIGGTYQIIDKERTINWIFTLDKKPDDLVFPLGRPQPSLYMAHPVKTNHYYPMKGVEETLFMEKVREFCWLVQCLGAKEVSFHSNKGLSVSQGMGSSMNIDAQVGVKGVNVGGGYGNTRKRDDAYTSNQQVELVQNFTPKKRAYCPDDLIWLDSDPAWQMLIKQRLEGGLIEYTYKISSSETCQMSTNEMDSVKANFEYMMVKVNGSYDVTRDQTFSNNEETEWSIHVEFAPLEELHEQQSNNNKGASKLTDKESEYLDMVKECLEDGEIGSRERKLLDKIRVKNGISEERAKELESTLTVPQLTDDEKEYLEAFKDACEDGKVSDKQRRLLEKLRVMYGISEERAKLLENI